MDADPSPPALKVFLVEDATPVRRRIAMLMGAISGVVIVGQAEDGQTALEGILACEANVAVFVE